jgi:hypothetical protein
MEGLSIKGAAMCAPLDIDGPSLYTRQRALG